MCEGLCPIRTKQGRSRASDVWQNRWSEPSAVSFFTVAAAFFPLSDLLLLSCKAPRPYECVPSEQDAEVVTSSEITEGTDMSADVKRHRASLTCERLRVFAWAVQLSGVETDSPSAASKEWQNENMTYLCQQGPFSFYLVSLELKQPAEYRKDHQSHRTVQYFTAQTSVSVSVKIQFLHNSGLKDFPKQVLKVENMICLCVTTVFEDQALSLVF